MSGLGEVKHLLHHDDAPPPEEHGVIKAMRTLDRAVARVEEVGLAICMVTLILLGVYQAASRNYFPPTPFWIDELIRYSVFFIGLIGAALAAQSDRLFNIDMFSRLFSARGKLVIRVLTAVFTIYICWLFLKGGLRLRAAILDEEGELIKPAIGILSLPVACGLISLHLAIHVAIDVFYLATGKTPPDLATVAKMKAH